MRALQELLQVSRLNVPARDDCHPATAAALEGVYKNLGFVPNVFRLASLSPSALAGLIGLQGALSKSLDGRLRERIALAVSQANECDYCLATHNWLGLNFAKLSPEEIALNKKGQSSDPKAEAAVHFAMRVVQLRGKVTDADLDSIRTAGYSDADIVEIVAVSVYYLFSNFLNNVADTDIDFPMVDDMTAYT